MRDRTARLEHQPDPAIHQLIGILLRSRHDVDFLLRGPKPSFGTLRQSQTSSCRSRGLSECRTALQRLSLVVAVGVARDAAETGLAPRRPSAAAAIATRDFNPGAVRMGNPFWLDGLGPGVRFARAAARCGRSAKRRWPQASRLSSPFLPANSVIGCDPVGANRAGDGLRRGWKTLEFDRTAVGTGLFPRIPW